MKEIFESILGLAMMIVALPFVLFLSYWPIVLVVWATLWFAGVV